MEPVQAVVDVLRKPARGRPHEGLKYINGHDELAAKIILQRNWDGKRAVSSMYKMAQSVDLILGLNLNWQERTYVARLLLSALTYSGIYRLELEDESNSRSPYIIVLNESASLSKPLLPDRTSFKKFPQWISNVDQEGNVLVKPCKPQAPEDEFYPLITGAETLYDDNPKPWLHAVRILEGVGFRINEPFLKLVEELDANPSTRLIHETPSDYEEQRSLLEEQRIALNMDELDRKYRDKEKRTRLEEKIRRKWWKQSYLLKQRRQSYEQRYKEFHRQLTLARKLRGKVFYHRLDMCHRGRIYYPADFSIQGSDFARAVIEFDTSAPLYADGLKALLHHAQNVSEGSADHDIKTSKAHERLGEFLEIALDPVSTFNNWKDADKPFCFLRSCQEIGDAMGVELLVDVQHRKDQWSTEEQKLASRGLKRWKGKDQNQVDPDGKPVFSTRLPIEMDQSNSAYQHIGLMMQDESLMALANMGEAYSDLYSTVANHPDLQIAGLDDPKEKRKIVKLVSVPWGYGSGWQSCADDLDKFRRENPGKAAYLWTREIEEINDLAKLVVSVLEKSLDTCVRFRRMVEGVVEQVEKTGSKEQIDFLTPLMFPMVIRKCTITSEKKSPQVRVWSGERDVYPKVRKPLHVQWYPEKGQRAIQSAASAGLVHSMDAALIHGVVAYGRIKEIREGDDLVMEHDSKDWIWYPLATCHDAFFCLAPTVEDLKERLEEGLFNLYDTFDPLKTFVSQNLIPGQPFNPEPLKTGLKTGKNIFD